MTGMTRRASAALTAGVLVIAVSCYFTGRSAAVAQACSTFNAVAASQGAQLEVNHTGSLVDEADIDIPAAQAAVDSQGDSNAYAAEPYPGTNVMSVFGLANLPQSTYPPLAQSSYPTRPHATTSGPALSLEATSGETSSTGSATSGANNGASAGVGVLAATSNAGCAADGTVSARAESDDQAFELASGLLRIGRVHSLAQVVVGTDGVPHVDSQLDLAQMSVAGQAVELSQGGLTTGGSSTALPSSASVTEALAAVGITLSYLAASRDSDGNGVVSPGVAITLARQAQAPQPTAVTYVLGQSYARAQIGSGGPATDDSVVPAPSDTGGNGGQQVTATPGGPAASAPAVTGSSAPTGPSSALPPATAAPFVSGPLGSEASSRGAQALSRPYLAAFSSEAVYLGIVVGACALLGSLILIRLLGVKTRWI